MADFIAFDQGEDALGEGVLAGFNWKFDLSTKSVDSTSPYVETETYATRGTAVPGTGYTQQAQANPGFTNGTAVFTQITWATGAATDWSSSYRSVVASNGTVAICAWNLQAGGAARDLSAANTTENFTPTLIIS